MKKLAVAAATGALMLTLAGPAEAAVVRPIPPHVLQYRDRSPHECYSRSRRSVRGDCYDERRPQHDGRGSILF